ncbi:hypothetical protein PGT21_031388 [Puccinia graminis f. sp. tritici]|uniref:Uncharacterized protein n=1 Tax=Puccinia graminis f. sp. tritici TaxID=56615 RepID=A0A5B0Q803_PUCGR|nr:hypothetical protein PGT21_031388 [Puccinia graminis f. sp. tritici]KAA1109277.1 hypothetical protein PGTUg99_025458 [Puccinia graminis f. sp. tritici]
MSYPTPPTNPPINCFISFISPSCYFHPYNNNHIFLLSYYIHYLQLKIFYSQLFGQSWRRSKSLDLKFLRPMRIVNHLFASYKELLFPIGSPHATPFVLGAVPSIGLKS